MKRLLIVVLAVVVAFLTFTLQPAESQTKAGKEQKKVVLSLGSDSYIPKEKIEAELNIRFISEPQELLGDPELKDPKLKDISAIVISNVAFGSLPSEVRTQLADYVKSGGALYITGGTQSYGVGGYKEVAEIIPYTMRISTERRETDWIGAPHKQAVIKQPGHPIVAGVRFPLISLYNDMNPRSEASEIVYYEGGPFGGPTAKKNWYHSPLVAELRCGKGLVIGVAFDPAHPEMRAYGGVNWAEADTFTSNIIRYLVKSSQLGPPVAKPKKK